MSDPTPYARILDEAFRAQELAALRRVLEQGVTQARLDAWLQESSDRGFLLQDAFWGSIRWSKQLGRPQLSTLDSGFSLSLQFHLQTYLATGAGNAPDQDKWVDRPAPSVWAVSDDDEHFQVLYAGTYVRWNRGGYQNRVLVNIVGPWTNPAGLGDRLLLARPYGKYFWSVDGRPFVLDEIVVDQELLQPVSRWSISL